jgi:integral membrane sensor domain MASE1
MTEILNLSVKTIETHTSFLPAFLPLPLVLWAASRVRAISSRKPGVISTLFAI